jgi:hypothetical protein
MILREHIEEFRTADDGRLFRTATGGMIFDTTHSWAVARTLALSPEQVVSPLAARPYDLRHAAVSLWLNGGVAATEVANRAGHSVEVLLRVYAKCMCATRRSFICPAKRGEIGGISLDPMAYPEPKGHPGNNSMPGNQRSCPGVRGDALGDLHDMAKAVLPEA